VSDYNGFAQLVEGSDSASAPQFATPALRAVKGAGGYEQFIAQQRIVPTRAGNWHDLFNALIWLHYPRFKWAANALQIAEAGSHEMDPRNKRTAVQSRAAQFDEGGVLLLVDDLKWLKPLETLDWHEFFVTQRALFEDRIRCCIVGHALFESLLQPFMGITAKALAIVWPVNNVRHPCHEQRGAIDEHVARCLPAALRANDFYPLPVLGVPGWHPDQSEAFYADPRYFRRRRKDANSG